MPVVFAIELSLIPAMDFATTAFKIVGFDSQAWILTSRSRVLNV